MIDSEMHFPKRTENNLKGVTGRTYFENFVNQNFKCIFHPIHEENDFGIDGYIELVINGNVTGKLIGIQLKHGDSFFKASTNYGYKYVGEGKHLNYYSNSTVPIFIIIMDENFNRMHWVQFDENKTMPQGLEYWWIEVPEENKIQTNFQEAIFKVSSPIIDYKEEIKLNWSINSKIQDCDSRIIAISKEDIINYSFDCINNMIDRLSINKKTLIDSKASIDIFFPEYDMDSREIFQIPEIMKWLKHSIDIGIPWFYLLNYKHKNIGLNLLVHSYCNFIDITRNESMYLVNYNKLDLAKFMEKNFINLNTFTYKHNISTEINQEISDGIIKYYFN